MIELLLKKYSQMLKNKAVTLVEIMVVVAVLAIILLPITGLLKNVTEIFLRSKQTLDIQAELRAAYNFLENDFRGASFSSLENYVFNGNVEFGSSGSIPEAWAVNFTSSTNGANFRILTSSAYNGMNALLLIGNLGIYLSTGSDSILSISTPAIRTPIFTLKPGTYRFLFWYGL
ncbi:MAG: prepilin-type N-terminal cleavage/methylation domain-containing protein [bacterium]|nr:prepilin-type N-terminal cleavage/methylation domain-containing protein [bacterium]